MSVNYNGDLEGTGQLLCPENVIHDEAQTTMAGRPVLRYHARRI